MYELHLMRRVCTLVVKFKKKGKQMKHGHCIIWIFCAIIGYTLNCSAWGVVGTCEYQGVEYQLVDYSDGSKRAIAVRFMEDVAFLNPYGTKVSSNYSVDNYRGPAYIGGTTGTLYVPTLAVDWRVNSDTNNRLFWCATNVESIIVANFSANYSVYPSTLYDRYYDYNMEGKLFRGCGVFKLLVLGGNVPMLRYEEATGGQLPSDVAMDTIQDILWHTEEFYYPAQYSNSWETAIRKLSYAGKYGAYSGEEFSRENIIPDSGNLRPVEPPIVTNYVYSSVTNYVVSTITNEVFHYSTVTNEIFHYTTVTNVVKYVPEPGASPDAGYGINVGAGGETVIAGAAGWDAFGVPDGMEWDKETGTLSGRAKLSGAYDLILVSGSGADTKIMRTTLTVAPYDTIIGYVGVAFSQSGAPLDNLKSYKTLPAGLKWVSGGRGATALPGVLQGVPTKAQTLDLETADGEPVKIEINALPDSVVGTFDGCVYFPPSDPTNGVANTCDIGGTITLAATAAGKISASVKTAKKTYSFSMASWAKFAEGNAFTLEASAELKTGEVLEVNATVRDGATMVLAKLSGGEFGGPRGTALPEKSGGDGCVTVLARDMYAKNGSKWIDEEAHGLMAKCKGTYQFGFDAVEENDDGGHAWHVAPPAWTLRPVAKVEAAFLKVVLKDTGVVTITGTLPDKTKVNLSTKATAFATDGSNKVEIMILSAAFSGKTITLPVEVNLMNDGSFAEGRTDCGIIYSIKR